MENPYPFTPVSPGWEIRYDDGHWTPLVGWLWLGDKWEWEPAAYDDETLRSARHLFSGVGYRVVAS